MSLDPELLQSEAQQAFNKSYTAQSSDDSVTLLVEANEKFRLAREHAPNLQFQLSALLSESLAYCELAQVSGKTGVEYSQKAVLSAQQAHDIFSTAHIEDLQTKSNIHGALGAALLYHYICRGAENDLVTATSELRTSIDITPPDAPDVLKASYHKTHYAIAIYLSSRRLGLRHPDPMSMRQWKEALSLCDALLTTTPIFPTFVASGIIMLLGSKEFVLGITPGAVSFVAVPPTQSPVMQLGDAVYMQQINISMGIWQMVVSHGDQTGMKPGSITGQLGCLTSRLLQICSSNDSNTFSTCAREISGTLDQGIASTNLYHGFLLIDMLAILVWQRARHRLYFPGLVQKIEHRLDQILPDTHILRAELQFRMGKWSQAEQRRSGIQCPRFYYITDLCLTLIETLTLPTILADPAHKASVIEELKNLSKTMEEFAQASGMEPGHLDMMTKAIGVLDTLSSRDPRKYLKINDLVGVMESIKISAPQYHPESRDEAAAGTLVAVADLRLRVAANDLQGLGLGPAESLHFIEEAVKQWQELDTRRSDPGLIEVDIDFGLGESLFRQGQLMLGLDKDSQEARGLISKGIDYMNRSVESKCPSNPTDIRNIVTLGEAYLWHYMGGHSGADNMTGDLETAMATFQSSGIAADSLGLPPSTYQSTFGPWATWADKFMQPSALEAYSRIIDAQSQAPWVGFGVQVRYEVRRHLFDLSDTAAAAASYACMVGNPIQAIEFLEKARSTVYAQTLTLRSSYDNLRDIDPSLADELAGQKSTDEQYQDVQRLRALGQEWDQAVSKIRGISGYEDFLKVPPVDKLCAAAVNGPVVLIVTSNPRGICYGILIKSTTIEDIEVIQLPLTAQKAKELAGEFDITVSDHVRRVKQDHSPATQRYIPGLIEPSEPSKLNVNKLLMEVWRFVMRPIIERVKSMEDRDTLPHIWLNVTGPLSSLPLHAAGEYDQDGCTMNYESVMDHVICSYTPTLSNLVGNPPPDSGKTKLFTLAGGERLSETSVEVKVVRDILGQHATTISLDGNASVSEVRTCLKDAHVAHFACHGIQDLQNPLKSRLSFSTESEILLEDLMSYPLPNARLAVLLACETAQGDKPLEEESLHLAGTMLFAGFRGVIGTLWPMEDEDGPRLCDDFYSALVQEGGEGEVDYSRAGAALHQAVRELKELGVGFFRWAPFVHLGQ